MTSRFPSSALPELQIWAPKAHSVEIELDGPRLEHGTRYAIRLDGGDPLPDPRSRWQPDGVHGRSAWVDHSRFRWTDAGWSAGELRDQVIYELHVGTFSAGGDFDGVAGHLDHLLDLGVTAIELMPVAEFAGERGWGYDGVLLYAPHHAYGGPEGLKRLVDTCHARGLAVILDVVYNHVGAEGNYLPRFGPYFSHRHASAWGDAFNFDGLDAPEVRRFVTDNAAAWIREYHFDGLRLDAVHAIRDDSARHIVADIAAAAHDAGSEQGRRVWVTAESNVDDPKLLDEYGCDAQWFDYFHHALHAYVTGERDSYYAPFGSYEKVEAALARAEPRLVTFIQNHDQVGNRAQGDRLSQQLPPERLRWLAEVLLTAPGVPLLFQGEEWGAGTPFQFFADHGDPGIRRATTEGRIREFAAFGWERSQVPDPEDPATFERSRLDWTELDRSPHGELLAFYRDLIQRRVGSLAEKT